MVTQRHPRKSNGTIPSAGAAEMRPVNEETNNRGADISFIGGTVLYRSIMTPKRGRKGGSAVGKSKMGAMIYRRVADLMMMDRFATMQWSFTTYSQLGAQSKTERRNKICCSEC